MLLKSKITGRFSFLCCCIAVVAIVFLPSTRAIAETINIEASLQTRMSISATKNSDLSFGILNFDPVHAGRLQLGTNGVVKLADSEGLTLGGGSVTAAEIIPSGDGKSIIEISCEDSGALSDGAGHNIPIQATEVSVGGGVDFGMGASCSGLGSAVVMVDLGTEAAPVIRMGAELAITDSAIASSATYSTANGGGDPITLQIVYQ